MTVVFWSTPEPMWLYLTPQHDSFLCNAIWGLKGHTHSPEVSRLALHRLRFVWIPWIFSQYYVWQLVKDLNSLWFYIEKFNFWFVWFWFVWDAPFIPKHDTLTYYQFTCLLWTVSKLTFLKCQYRMVSRSVLLTTLIDMEAYTGIGQRHILQSRCLSWEVHGY